MRAEQASEPEEATRVIHTTWKTRLLQGGALVGLLTVIAVTARAPGLNKEADKTVRWRPPTIETLDEAHELTLDVTITPAQGQPELRTKGGSDVFVSAGDGIDVAMHNRSEQDIFVAVFMLDADNAITWVAPARPSWQDGAAVKAAASNQPQSLAHIALRADTPSGRLDVIGMFFSEAVPLSEIATTLHDGGVLALRNMQHVIAMDTVPTTVGKSPTAEAQ